MPASFSLDRQAQAGNSGLMTILKIELENPINHTEVSIRNNLNDLTLETKAMKNLILLKTIK